MRASCGIAAFAGMPLLMLVVSCAGGGDGAAGGTGAPGVAAGSPAVRAADGGSRGTVLSTQGFDLAAGSGTGLVIDVPAAGALSATASWGGHGTDIDVYITDGTCPGLEDLVLGACTILGRGDSSTSKSETATALVEPARYQVFVLALGEQGDSGSIEFALAQ